jgi:hypothetical protein
LPASQESITFRNSAVEIAHTAQDIHKHGALGDSLLAILEWLQCCETFCRELTALASYLCLP